LIEIRDGQVLERNILDERTTIQTIARCGRPLMGNSGFIQPGCRVDLPIDRPGGKGRWRRLAHPVANFYPFPNSDSFAHYRALSLSKNTTYPDAAAGSTAFTNIFSANRRAGGKRRLGTRLLAFRPDAFVGHHSWLNCYLPPGKDLIDIQSI
jgi:hypothetical protein